MEKQQQPVPIENIQEPFQPPIQQQMPYQPPIQQQMPYQPPIQQQMPYQPPMQQQLQNNTNVTIVNQQPAAAEGPKLILGPVAGHREFTTGLFSCTEDVEGCIKSLICYSCLVNEITAKLDENICLTSAVPGALVTLRTKLRTLGGIRGSIFKDYLVMTCCQFCAICQMERELRAMM